jgi:hypothetical protein
VQLGNVRMPAEMAIVLAIHRLELSFSLASIRDAIISMAWGKSHCVRERPTEMPSAREFRENADDCLVWARTVTSEHERAIFLDMARNWLEAASKAEGRKITYKLRAKRWSKSPPATMHDEATALAHLRLNSWR